MFSILIVGFNGIRTRSKLIMTPNYFPVPKPSKSYWIENADSRLQHYRDKRGIPDKADVVIIGSGFTGTAVAAGLLLEREFKGNVVILEARDVCSGATGRNGGHLRAYYYENHSTYVERYGEKIAADIAIFEENSIKSLEDILTKYKIDCLLDKRLNCDTFQTESVSKKMMHDYYSFINNKYVPTKMKRKVHIYFGQQAENTSGHKSTICCVFCPTASVWPYKLVCSLLEHCIDKGLNLQTSTAVTDVRYLQDVEKWLLETPRGSIIANKVVVATNAYTAAILPEFRGVIVPVKGCVSHLKPADHSIKKLPYNYYHAYPMEGDYVTARSDGSIIVGGGGKTYLKYPESSEMINTVDDSVVPRKVANYFNGYANHNYILYKNKKYVNDYTWTGCMGYTNDGLPFVGDLTNFGRPNMYISSGYTGHGMPRIWTCGAYLADLIANSFRKTHIPEVYKITPERMTRSHFGYFDDLVGIDSRNMILAKF